MHLTGTELLDWIGLRRVHEGGVALLTAIHGADVGAVDDAEENRASRTVVVVKVARWSVWWRRKARVRTGGIGTVAVGRGRARTPRG